ncbi:MAG: hypothetical protein EBT15_11280 [Betaproteobacteria bacterium]|nr:hypothetical protein [Betaproteobacteria bacterium]
MILFQAEVLRRLHAVEARLDTLERVTAPRPVQPPAGAICTACSADRSQEPCRLNDVSQCTFVRVTA